MRTRKGGALRTDANLILAHRYRSAHAVRFVYTQTFALRTAFILAHAQGRCASVIRKRYRLFGYKPHFRAAAGSPCRSRYRFARFGECGFYLKNTMHLLRIPENVSVSFPHKADAHVGDVTR